MIKITKENKLYCNKLMESASYTAVGMNKDGEVHTAEIMEQAGSVVAFKSDGGIRCSEIIEEAEE